jgi:hypothetical protein
MKQLRVLHRQSQLLVWLEMMGLRGCHLPDRQIVHLIMAQTEKDIAAGQWALVKLGDEEDC